MVPQAIVVFGLQYWVIARNGSASERRSSVAGDAGRARHACARLVQ